MIELPMYSEIADGRVWYQHSLVSRRVSTGLTRDNYSEITTPRSTRSPAMADTNTSAWAAATASPTCSLLGLKASITPSAVAA